MSNLHNFSKSPAPNPRIAHLKPYESFDSHYDVRLNTNENPYSLDDEFINELCENVRIAAKNLNRYPQNNHRELTNALLQFLKNDDRNKCNDSVDLEGDQKNRKQTDNFCELLSEQNITVGNGSNEIMQEIFSAFGGIRDDFARKSIAITFTPSYSMYPQYARDSHTKLVEISRKPVNDYELSFDDAKQAIIEYKPSIILITNPNNPTGTWTPLETISAICDFAAASALVVVDEAYIEFASLNKKSAISLLEKHSNLVIVRTLSKAFSLAGARLGYAVASTRIIDQLKIVRLPYNISSITQVVGITALKNSKKLLNKVSQIRDARVELVRKLREIVEKVLESESNFINFSVGSDKKADEVLKFLSAKSIQIRKVGEPGFLRVTVGTQIENDKFLDGVKEFYG